jgi:transposase, IS6 family
VDVVGRFPPEVIRVAVRWYLRYGLSYRDVEKLLAERGVVVDHVTIYRWVRRFTPLLIDTARPCRHAQAIGGMWTRRRCYAQLRITPIRFSSWLCAVRQRERG